MRSLKTLIIVAVGIIAMACNNMNEKLAMLDATPWKLISLEGEANPAFAEESDSFVVNFSASENAIAGVGACNNFFGTFQVLDGGKIKIEITGATMMACPNMELEQPFFDLLNDCDSFDIEYDMLTLMSGDKQIAQFGIHNQE